MGWLEPNTVFWPKRPVPCEVEAAPKPTEGLDVEDPKSELPAKIYNYRIKINCNFKNIMKLTKHKVSNSDVKIKSP